jgi:hypothetical protein
MNIPEIASSTISSTKSTKSTKPIILAENNREPINKDDKRTITKFLWFPKRLYNQLLLSLGQTVYKYY